MADSNSRMKQEILEIPEAIERLLSNGMDDISKAAADVRTLDPLFAITVARGSSDHVCSYLTYAAELLLGIPCASMGPSIRSIYAAPMRLNRGVCIAISQSGQSPDISTMAEAARHDGALSIAITNDSDSPLSQVCAHTIPIHAGLERSVAATKTFVTSAVAGLMLLAQWKQDEALKSAIYKLPKALEAAAAIQWPEVQEAIGHRQSVFTLGRGPAWAISNEAALKLKETCQIHAESYSSAEVLHGPVSIVGDGFPVIAFAAADRAESTVTDTADQLASKGAQAFVTSKKAKQATTIEHLRTEHPLTDPLCLIISFYSMVENIAVAHGINPDTPRHLQKVTETI